MISGGIWCGRHPWRWVAVCFGAALVLVLAGCGRDATTAPPAAPAPSGPAGAVPPAARVPPANCTTKASDADSVRQALGGAVAGAVICVSGDLSNVRLKITMSGSPQSPIRLLGDGKVVTKGITVQADNVIVDGITAVEPKAPGVSLRGNNITFQNSTVSSPQGDDHDGIRFWGQNLRILHNTIRDTENADGAHADCMQTFATDEDSPASQTC